MNRLDELEIIREARLSAIDPLDEVCENCDNYILVNIRARCNEGKSMTKMKEIGCPLL